MRPSSKASCCLLEVVFLARKNNTVTNITGALRCASKVAQGKACTMNELKGTVTVLVQAYRSRQASLREQLSRVEFLERFIQNMK